MLLSLSLLLAANLHTQTVVEHHMHAVRSTSSRCTRSAVHLAARTMLHHITYTRQRSAVQAVEYNTLRCHCY
jgi:hypothetical protein